jgi:AraC-like DNA-binding protein
VFISVIMLRGLVAELQQRGIAREVALERLGITQQRLYETLGMTEVEFGEPVAAAVRWLGDRGLGLAIGARAPEHMLQLLGYLVFSAATLREACAQLSAYSGLVATQLEFRLQEQDDEAELRMEFQAAPLSRAGRRFASEFAMAFAARIHAELSNRAALTAACFTHSAPPHAQRYAEVFQGRVVFDAPHTCLRFPRGALDARSPRSDPSVFATLENVADKMLEQSLVDVSLERRVRAVLRQGTNVVHVDLGCLAAGLELSRRGLRRRLQKEGTSLSKIIAEERCRAARRALGSRDRLAIKQAADRLGYAETSTFHRAFKRWTGETPGQFVRNARPEP